MSRIFNEREAVAFLSTELSLPCKPSTLRHRRMIGGGPLYTRPLGRVQYDEMDLREWVTQLQGRKLRSTAEEARRHRIPSIAAE